MRPNIIKKIKKEIDEINLDSKSGIYAHIDGDDINLLKIMLIGPENTPYQGGFFLFKVNFPSEYPFVPPLVNFITPKRHQGCRLHPNLYQEGKVCLSILNTWGKADWSPALTIEKLFITIQGLLDENPITNEPGHESRLKTDPAAVRYSKVALYRTLKVAVLEMFSHPDLPKPFLKIIHNYFKENKEAYLKQLSLLELDNGKTIECFHGREVISYDFLKECFLQHFVD